MTVAEEHENSLMVSTATFDFGTCYAGSGTASRARLTVRNITKQPLELDLRNSVPPDVSFYMVVPSERDGVEAPDGREETVGGSGMGRLVLAVDPHMFFLQT